jgi:hypothetical protein
MRFRSLTRRVLRISILLILLSAATMAPANAYGQTPVSPRADNCNEQSIFVQDLHNRSDATQASIFLPIRAVDPACIGIFGNAWSMVNISDKTGDQAEVGYTESANSVHQFYTQICFQVQGAGEACRHPVRISTVDVNHFVAFRIANSPTSSNTFVGWYNDGHGWKNQGSGREPFHFGVSEGETSRHGHLTGMEDHHENLQYNSGRGWANWGAQSLDYSNVAGGVLYYYHKMSNTQYEICKRGGRCPWQ